MENEVTFKTGERPLTLGRSTFPYDRAITSLNALIGTTKCLILRTDEKTANQITFLRNLISKHSSGENKLKVFKDGKEIRMWVDKPVRSMLGA